MHDGAAAPTADYSAGHVAVDHSPFHHDTSHHHHDPSQHDVLVEIDSHRREHEHPHHPHPHQPNNPPPYTEDPTNPLYQPIYTTPHQTAFYGTMQRTSERCRCPNCMADVRALEAGHVTARPPMTVQRMCEATIKTISILIIIAVAVSIISALLSSWRGCTNFPSPAGCHW